MGLITRRFRPLEARSVTEWGSSAIPGPLGTGGVDGSYASVDLRRMEGSLQKVAVWSSVDLIAGLVAQLPRDTYRKILTRGSEPEQIANPKIVDEPGGDGYGASDWIYQYVSSKLLRGNAYARPDLWTDQGRPGILPLLHPDDVQGWRDRQTGKARWRVNGQELTDPARQMWHRRSYPTPGQLLGKSPIGHHMTAITQGISAARFGTQFFTDGGHPTMHVQNERGPIDEKAAVKVKARVMAVIWGSREPLVTGNDWSVKPLSVLPNESQFLETQRMTGAECCRIFGPCIAELLGYETGGSMTYQTIEQRSLDLLKFTLDRWIVDVETAFTGMIPAGQYVKLNRKALLATDLLTRYRAHNMAIAGHWLSPSEVRPIEDLPPMTKEQQAEIDAMALPAPVMNPLKESEK